MIWDNVWKKFDEWYQDGSDPSWEEQKEKIQELVEQALKEK